MKCEHGCGGDAIVVLEDGREVCGPCSVGGNPDCPVCTAGEERDAA